MSSYFVLNEGFQLRGWDDMPYALVDSTGGRALPLSSGEMDLLQMCDGTIDLDLSILPGAVREMAALAEKNGIIRRAATGERLRPEQAFHRYGNKHIQAAHWSVTGKCNYRCRHCYMSAPDARYGELSHDEVLRIAAQLAECGIQQVSLTGGEPLVRADFLEIVDALTDCGIRITTIYSNGKLVTEDLLRDLEQRGLRPEVNLSYDGEGWHDWLRGVPGAETAVREAFLRCQAFGFSTGAELCLHSGNRNTLRQSIRNLADWGCRSLKTNPIADIGAWKEGGNGPSLSVSDLFQLYLDYIPQYYEDGMPLSLQLGGFFSASPAEPKVFAVPLVKLEGTRDSDCICGHARQVMYISPEGRTLPCMALSGLDVQKKFPCILETGLAACLTDSFYMNFIETTVSQYLEQNPLCAACSFRSACAGGCRASGLEQDPGNLMAPDPAACELFLGGWTPRILQAVSTAAPHVRHRGRLPMAVTGGL